MRNWWLETTILILVCLWAFWGTWLEVPRLITGFPHAKRYVLDMFPPDWSILPDLQEPLLETIKIAVLAIILSSVVSIPLSFLAARSTTPHIGLYILSRGIVNISRGLPTIVWALLWVAIVGLGPLAGIIALFIHCVGTLVKIFSEAIEAVGPTVMNIMDAMRIDGASEFQALYYGLFREVAPLFVGYILYFFEYCLRVGTILGMVGAGGLGLYLTMTIRMFKRQQTTAILVVILGLVTTVDFTSYLIRKKLLGE